MAGSPGNKTDSLQGVLRISGTIPSAGLALSYSALLPEFFQTVLIIVHGLSEHRGRYQLLQLDLARAGIASYAYDQRGFGESDGSRTHVERYTDFIDDLHRVVAFVRKGHPGQKIVLLGHSFGGAVAATFCIDHPNEAEALVLSAPAYDVPLLPFRLHLLGYLFNRIFPSRPLRYPSNPGWLSRDPAVGLAFQNDPLVQRAGTPRFYVEFRRMNVSLHQSAGRIALPTLILQGSADRIVFPSGARALLARIGSEKKRLNWYEGFYHEVFNEVGRERVVDDLLHWLKEIFQ
ncbi:MAG: lysophospholipase [Nitrospirae bacterium]|nr:lysophospholipase [Candidatus Manganitrophaceae bacterium]